MIYTQSSVTSLRHRFARAETCVNDYPHTASQSISPAKSTKDQDDEKTTAGYARIEDHLSSNLIVLPIHK